MGQKISLQIPASLKSNSKKQLGVYILAAVMLGMSAYALARRGWFATLMTRFKRELSPLEKRCRQLERDIRSKNKSSPAI